MTYYIGMDVGTSGTKAVLFDDKGKALSSHTAEYPMEQPHNGWAEQDPERWWQAAKEALMAVASEVDTDSVKGIGLTGQMHSLVMLDAAGAVIRPAILWCDQRTAAECAYIEETVGHRRLMDITANPALTGFTASKLMWVKRHEPENYARCAHVLLAKDYIRYRLTGEFATDMSDASGMQLLDVAHRCWSAELLERLGVDPGWLGKLYESPEVTGGVTVQAAALTGLAVGTPVVAGAGDNAAAAVGTGTVRDGDAFTTIGTSGVVFAHTDRMCVDPKGRVHTFCCAVPGAWHVMGVTQAAGLSLKWFRDTLCPDLLQQDRPYVTMDQLAKEAGPGAHRLLFLPYLMGERTPHLDPAARGTFVGLSASHTRGDLIRAVLEGVSFSLKDCLSLLREMQVTPRSMMLCGGGSYSPLWREILTDVYGMPLLRLKQEEGPAMGAAILAMVGTGLYATVPEACDALVKKQPCAEGAGVDYTAAYALYRQLYTHLKEDYAALERL